MMSLDSKSVKKFYTVFVRINRERLGWSFSLIIMLSALNHGVEGSQKLGDVDVHCSVNKDKVLTCFWTEQADVNETYTFYYWFSDQESSAVHCPRYLVTNQKIIGCQFSVEDTFRPFTLKLNSTSQRFSTIKFDKLQDWVKMDPPSNLHVQNTSSLELLLTWDQSLGSFPPRCMTYQVRHQNMASSEWTVKDASSKSFTLPSYDPRQIYTFQVRSQINIHCGNSKLWSDWSQAVVWGRNVTVTDEQPSAFTNAFVITGVTVMLVVVVILVIRTDRIWMIFVPQIPNPGKKFEDLFTVYKYNFQDWLGISKEAVEDMKTNYTETFCVVSEDPDCPDPDEKIPTINSPTE